MTKILHFADAHIDMANYGRHDPYTGLPLRVLDFLKSLDAIVDAAITEKVDLVIFAGDAYKDRSPAPTFQREWGRRVMRLSRQGIQTLLLVGNHDLSPALGRAHALDSFDTLEVPHVRVLDKPAFLGAAELGLPLQILCLPWISRSGLMASLETPGADTSQVLEQIEMRLTRLIHEWIEQADPSLPILLTAHCSVQGAQYGSERTVMLGGDLVLPRSLVCDPRLDYVALGHIHKYQNLNEGSYPPVVYPGSIERVDFGEARDDKGFVIAEVSRGGTRYEWRRLEGTRPFIDRYLRLENQEDISEQLREALPAPAKLDGAIVRLVLEYPQEWEASIDDAGLREYTGGCFEFHLVKRPQIAGRVRIPEDQSIGSYTPGQLLEIYWHANHLDEDEIENLSTLAAQLLQDNPS
jgi:DNA repair protein SbcD/Mre11